MEALAEQAEQIETFQLSREKHGQSHSAVRVVGEMLVDKTVELRQIPQYEMVKANTFSGVVEMLGTDRTATEVLDIDPEDEYPIIDGQARDKDGTPITARVANGVYTSAGLAKEDSRFIFEHRRGVCDVHVAEVNNRLLPGQSHVTVSMKPVKGLVLHPEVYKDQLGYGDLVYVQWYSNSGEVLTGGASSILVKDNEAFKHVLDAHGFQIPDGEPEDQWILHGQIGQMNPEEAKDFAQSLRDDYYESVGVSGERKSATEYVKANQQIFDTLFDTYFPELAKAIFTEKNNQTLQSLAQAMLKTDLRRMKKGIKADLIKVANTNRFDDELGRTMEVVIRYSIVEQLRKGLRLAAKTTHTDRSAEWSANAVFMSPSLPEASIHYTNQLMARNLSEGVQAGRSYGGCPGQVKLTDGDMEWGSGGIFSNDTAGSLQWSYGGRGGGRRSRFNEDDGDCTFTSKKCPECKARNVTTTVKKISSTYKRISGSCKCVKVVPIKA